LLDLAKRALVRGVGVTTPALWLGPDAWKLNPSVPAAA